MIRVVTVVVCLALASASLTAADTELDRLADAGIVIEEIVTGTDIPVPAAGRRFVDALEKNAPRNASQKATH